MRVLAVAVLSGLAVGAWTWTPATTRVRRLHGVSTRTRAPRPAVLVVALSAGGGLVAAGWPGALLAGLGAATMLRLRERAGRERAAAARRDAVADVVAALAAELRAGQPLPAALANVVDDRSPLHAELRAAATAAASGADPADLLVAAAAQPGAAGLRALAACCRVGATTGAALAPTLDSLAGALAADRAVRAAVDAELAGPRATSRVLLGLPLVGVGMAAGMGAEPLQLLLHTAVGLALCLAAAALAAAGFTWLDRLAARAQPP